MYHILVYSHRYINNATCMNMWWKIKDRTTMSKSFVGYFTFYNNNGLHYKIKDHSLLDLTNKYLLMVDVYFLFSFSIKFKRPQVRDRQKPVWFVCQLYIIYYFILLDDYLMKVRKNEGYIYLLSFLTFWCNKLKKSYLYCDIL